MTAKTKHGHKAHRPAHGADPGTPHERLNRLHAQPGRPEGAMHEGGSAGTSQMPSEAPTAPPPGAGPGMPPMGGAPMGAGPATDDEEGELT